MSGGMSAGCPGPHRAVAAGTREEGDRGDVDNHGCVGTLDGSGRGHHGPVSTSAETTLWPMPTAPDREALVASSDARLTDSVLPSPPPIAAPPHPGRFEVIDDRGVYLRSARPADGADPDPALPVTLYVHGLAGNSANFDTLGTVLAGHTRGFAVDLPGFGRSDPPPGERYSLDGDADLVAAVIDRISPDAPVHVVGNSLGGMVSISLAARYPDKVRTLSLISPAVPDLRMTTERGADPRLGILMAPGTTGLALRRLSSIGPLDRARGMAALCYGDPRCLTAGDIEAAATELGWRYPLPWGHTATVFSLRALMRSYLRAGRTSFRAVTRRITAPALVIWGTKDRLVDCSLAPATAAAVHGARLLVLPGCGHVAQMEQPAITARAILALWEDTATPGAPSGTTHRPVTPSSP